MQATVKAEDLAGILGLSDAAVRQLARRGIVVKAGKGAFAFEKSVQNYCAHLRGLATGRKTNDGPAAGRARLAKMQADSLEQRMAIQRGELLSAKAVQDEWTGICRMVRTGILRIPRRAGSRLGLAPDAVQALDDEVRAVLTELVQEATETA